jgi:hypothetical protein
MKRWRKELRSLRFSLLHEGRPLSEHDWLACGDPEPMLQLLGGKVNDRKLRLFSVACCRVLWGLFTHRLSRAAIEMAERYADDPSLRDELRLAFETVDGLFDPDGEPNIESALASLVCEEPLNPASVISVIRAIQVLPSRRTRFKGVARAKAYPRLLRDIFGNLFRPVRVFPTWQTANVVSLAQTIYDERAFDRMPILGDALEDAGCDNADILNHCRQPAEHVRGCWVVDAILEKK